MQGSRQQFPHPRRVDQPAAASGGQPNQAQQAAWPWAQQHAGAQPPQQHHPAAHHAQHPGLPPPQQPQHQIAPQGRQHAEAQPPPQHHPGTCYAPQRGLPTPRQHQHQIAPQHCPGAHHAQPPGLPPPQQHFTGWLNASTKQPVGPSSQRLREAWDKYEGDLLPAAEVGTVWRGAAAGSWHVAAAQESRAVAGQ